MSGDDDFHGGEITAQQQWQTSAIWDKARRARLLLNDIPEQFQQRLAESPFFFLATSNKEGACDCSFKGGGPGIIKILDSKQLVFPDFDGNGAFMSIGNILENHHVGLLFIDFSDGGRLRINGVASIHDKGRIKDLFPDHPRAIHVSIEQVIPNCAAHVPILVPGGQACL
jgi:predicted pyridoxine 5'-phosphate oxidase superfamily flavin-nucleotide-binding protein